jgi:tripartite-type tricarboxylate transporter receptor subunit TctC
MFKYFKQNTLLAQLNIAQAAIIFIAVNSAITFPATAQTFPSKPIKVVVSFPPGGAADQIARAVSVPLSEAIGQPVLVENRAGANGNIGAEAVAKSPADGYSLLMSSGGTV